MPVRTRSQERHLQQDDVDHRHHSPGTRGKLYPSLDGLKGDSSPNMPKRSPRGAERGRTKNKGQTYRNSPPEDEPRDLETDSDDDELNDGILFDSSLEKQNLSGLSSGSRNQSPCQHDQSLHRHSWCGTDDFTHGSSLDRSKTSDAGSPRQSLASANVSSSSPSVLETSAVRKRQKQRGFRPESVPRPNFEAVPNATSRLPEYCIYCILILILLVFIYIAYVGREVDQSTPSSKLPVAEKSYFDLLDKTFLEARKKFPNQTERFWKVIRVQLKSLFRRDPPRQPAIILFAAPPHAVEVMNCITRVIGRAVADITKSNSPIVIHGGEMASKEENSAKFELDKALSEGFQQGQLVAILHELESFSAQPLLLLHSYCDHENAAFKDVVIMLTLRLDTSGHDRKVNDEFIEDYLAQIWGDKVGIDEMGALRSRIANNKVISNAESDDVLNQFCSQEF